MWLITVLAGSMSVVISPLLLLASLLFIERMFHQSERKRERWRERWSRWGYYEEDNEGVVRKKRLLLAEESQRMQMKKPRLLRDEGC